MARGPRRVPGRSETRSSVGAPITATSTPTSSTGSCVYGMPAYVRRPAEWGLSGRPSSRQRSSGSITRRSSRRRRAGIASPDLVDEGGEAVGDRGVADLEHVLGVALARAGEVEAADERRVVGDHDLRVHEVV